MLSKAIKQTWKHALLESLRFTSPQFVGWDMVWRVSLFWAPQDEHTSVLMNLGPRTGSYWLVVRTTLKNRKSLSIFLSLHLTCCFRSLPHLPPSSLIFTGGALLLF